MGSRASIVWDESLLGYKLSNDHPLNPIRLDLTVRLATALGVLDGVQTLRPEPLIHIQLLLRQLFLASMNVRLTKAVMRVGKIGILLQSELILWNGVSIPVLV